MVAYSGGLWIAMKGQVINRRSQLKTETQMHDSETQYSL